MTDDDHMDMADAIEALKNAPIPEWLREMNMRLLTCGEVGLWVGMATGLAYQLETAPETTTNAPWQMHCRDVLIELAEYVMNLSPDIDRAWVVEPK